MRWLLVVILILIAPVIFVLEWLSEQRSAAHMAWLNSFAELPRLIKKTLKAKETR